MLFTQIAGEVSGNPGVRVVMDSRRFTRPRIFAGRRLAVAGHEDGIAVRLDGERKRSAVQVAGCRVLNRNDGLAVAGMVAVPWSARDHWREMAHAAVQG